MKLIYPGPFEAVFVPACGQAVKRGEAIDVADEAVALSLIEQGWTEPKAATKKAASKAAPTTEADAPANPKE